jgi:ribosome-associated protein YbcJ (S4-like RNA binding protein)
MGKVEVLRFAKYPELMERGAMIKGAIMETVAMVSAIEPRRAEKD